MIARLGCHLFRLRFAAVAGCLLAASFAEEATPKQECVIVKGAGYGFRGENIDPTVAEINRRIVAFFLKYLTAP